MTKLQGAQEKEPTLRQMTLLLVLLFCLIAVSLFIALVTLPQWCVRACHQFRIWRLRDDLADAMLSKRLPKENEAVHQLFGEMEGVLREEKTVSLINLGLWNLAKRSVRRDLRWPSPRPSIEDLDVEQLALLRHYRDQFDVLLAGSVLTSSWLGVALIFYRYAQLKTRPQLRRADSPLSDFDQATDQAVRQTRLIERGALEPFMLPA